MGLDAFYQAVAEETEMFRLALKDQDYAEALLSIQTFIDLSQRDIIPDFYVKHIKRVTEFVTLAREIVGTHPGIEERTLLWGQHWDMIHYLLSPARRENLEGVTQDEVIVKKAIFGSSPLPTTPQAWIYYVRSDEVAEIANYLTKISVESLRAYMNVTRMRERSVYKSNQLSTDNDAEFEIIKDDFITLRDFYRFVAEKIEGVITHRS